MTRRTDWADHEYTSSGTPWGKGTRDDSGSAGGGAEAHGTGGDRYGGDGEGRPAARRRRAGGTTRGSDGSYGRGGSYEDDGPPDSYGAYENGTPENGTPENGTPENGTPENGTPENGTPENGTHENGTHENGTHENGMHDGPDGPRGHGSPGRGSRKPGARRRRGFGEPSGEDGGSSSLSRAEQGEPPADPAERARAICLRLLTGTPRTRKQLADALRKREIPEDIAEEVLSRFEEVGLINDSAFADAWVESRHHGRGLARRALAQELRTKGVDTALIDEAVARLDSEQEEETARELVARKLRSTRGLDRDKRIRRLAGMLARKGYPEGMALRVVRRALEEEGEDTDFLEGGDF
ncbi:recombination regulator RecX [Streptomyces sp. NPDC005917]|uniref:recombination regulator RecX n=1 Tax=unclassified Streptomyces TaxID=2593676 RepID=UPI0033EE2C76